MGYKLHPTTREAIAERYRTTGMKAQPGDCWEEPNYLADPDTLEWYKRNFFSVEYMRDWMDKRGPIFVILPSGDQWCIDQRAHGNGDHGWTVTGEMPNLTAHPSILVSGYHGWLRNGELTEDTDGRTYPDRADS